MMRKIIYFSLFTFIFSLTACEHKLDIVPKGQVTLQTVGELELLMNQEFMINDLPSSSLGMICGESVGMFDPVASVLAQTNTCGYAFLACDETVNRAVLTTEDARYNDIYKYVNYMNVVVNKMAEAEGDETQKPALVAEARVMRAYLHWLVVGIYARQYDAATADKLGGIAYNTSMQVTEIKQKLTLEQSYQQILNDLDDETIKLLPIQRKQGTMRGDQAWANAVKAMVLFQMKQYDKALPYAQKAISMRPQMFDRSVIKTTGAWEQAQLEDSYFLYIGAGVRVSPTLEMLSIDTGKMFEQGDYVQTYDNAGGWSLAQGENMSGLQGVRMYMGWGTMCNVWGLTSEQLRYVAAECLIRTGRIDEGLQMVDEVRRMRVENATPFSGTVNTESKAMALLQRAKWVECIATPFNFLDMKRWNSEPAYKRNVTHNLGSLGTFTLSPESPLWVQAFPSNATRYNNTLTQNY